jgi:hypothetical protein
LIGQKSEQTFPHTWTEGVRKRTEAPNHKNSQPH